MIKKILVKALSRFPATLMLLRLIRDFFDQRQPAIQTPWGFALSGNQQMATGTFEKEETALIRKILIDVDLMINVGANVGYYCCHALSLSKPVIAIEPIPRNLFFLMENLDQNNWSDSSEIFPVALGSNNDILKMWGSDTGASLVPGWANIPKNYVQKVPTLTLDRVIGERIKNKKALILVDVEGSEFDMLQGAISTLSNSIRPIWIVEITTHQNQPTGVTINPNFIRTFEVFFSYDYRAFAIQEQKEVELLMSDILNIGTALEYDNYNFIFK